MNLSQAEYKLVSVIQSVRESGETASARAEELGVSLDGAYRIQAALGEGRVLKGYKLGLLSPAKQRQMGVDSPIFGRVYDDMIFDGPVRLGQMVQPRLEPELAVVLRDSLLSGSSANVARLAVGGTYLAIDFLSSAWEDYSFGIADVVADNASGGGFLLGERLLPRLPGGNLRLYHDGRLLTEGAIESLGEAGKRLAWLADAVGGLKPGQIIFLGSPAAAKEALPGTIELYGPYDSVLSARLES